MPPYIYIYDFTYLRHEKSGVHRVAYGLLTMLLSIIYHYQSILFLGSDKSYAQYLYQRHESWPRIHAGICEVLVIYAVDWQG